MTDEEREAAMRSLILDGDTDGATHSEDELLLWDLYRFSCASPHRSEQRIAHLQGADGSRSGRRTGARFLLAFARGPVAAHALLRHRL
jgi:hypothetical protein